MVKKTSKGGASNYWRVTLYLSKRQDYSLITAAAKIQNLSASQWLMKHALQLARVELQAGQAAAEIQPSLDRDLIRTAKNLPRRNEEHGMQEV